MRAVSIYRELWFSLCIFSLFFRSIHSLSVGFLFSFSIWGFLFLSGFLLGSCFSQFILSIGIFWSDDRCLLDCQPANLAFSRLWYLFTTSWSAIDWLFNDLVGFLSTVDVLSRPSLRSHLVSRTVMWAVSLHRKLWFSFMVLLGSPLGRLPFAFIDWWLSSFESSTNLTLSLHWKLPFAVRITERIRSVVWQTLIQSLTSQLLLLLCVEFAFLIHRYK